MRNFLTLLFALLMTFNAHAATTTTNKVQSPSGNLTLDTPSSASNIVIPSNILASDPTKTHSFSGVQINNAQIGSAGTDNLTMRAGATGDTTLLLNGNVSLPKVVSYTVTDDATTTGSNASLAAMPTSPYTRFTNSLLYSIDQIPAPASGTAARELTFFNGVGHAILLNFETGATAANRIIAPQGGTFTLRDGMSVDLVYNAGVSRWVIKDWDGLITTSVVGPWTAFTPTVATLTNSTPTGFYRINAQNIDVIFKITLTGTPAATTGIIVNGPAGYTVNSAIMTSTLANIGGSHAYDSSGNTHYLLQSFWSGGNGAILTVQAASTGQVYGLSQVAPFVFAVNDVIDGYFSYPVNELSANTNNFTLPENDAGSISEIMFTGGTTAPKNFISAMNKTIGNTGADYNGAEYKQLYDVLWNMPGLSTTAGDTYRISSAKGASADADWAANKLITIDYATNGSYVRAKSSARNLGSYSPDAFQGHKHSLTVTNSGFGSNNGIGRGDGTVLTAFNAGSFAGGTENDGVNGTPRTGSETKAKDTALNAWIRYSYRNYIVGAADIPVPTITRLTSGSGTVSIAAGAKYIKVRMIGGGGGAMGSSTSGWASDSAGTGGSTTFGLATATGGGKGAYGSGGGGNCTLGGYSGNGLSGFSGGGAGYKSTAGPFNSGFGGGPGGAPSAVGAFAGPSGVANSGGGGAGGSLGGAVAGLLGGGGGSGGVCEFTISLPASSYSYAIGAGGAGGAAGTSGYAGGAGGSGIIIVEEYYQ